MSNDTAAPSAVAAHDKPLALKEAQDEVMRKIGRNVLLFQEIEGLFKHVVVNTRIEGTSETFVANYQARLEQVKKHTLGVVVGRFAKETLATDYRSAGAAVHVEKPALSLGFQLEIAQGSRATHEAELSAMVDARNELIHQLSQRQDLRTIEGCSAAGGYLERQFGQFKPMRDRMLGICRAMDEDLRSVLAHLASEDGQRQFEVTFLRQSALIRSLEIISREIGASDGWAPLATAGQLLRKRLPDEVSMLKERYGHRTLKRILMASELFDVREEATAKGGTRTEFRIKPYQFERGEG